MSNYLIILHISPVKSINSISYRLWDTARFFGYVYIVGKFWGLYLILFSYPHSLIFLFVEVVKELRIEKEKNKDTFKLKFYFGGLWLFCGEECFPEPVESQGVWRIS